MSSRLGPGGPKLRRLNMGQIFIILAVVSALFTIVIFKSVMSHEKPAVVEEKVKSKPVIVAVTEINPGETITSSQVSEVQWPIDLYPKADVFSDTKGLVGRVADKPIHTGEPVYRLDLAGEDSRGGLTVVIPEGYRAMTVAVSEIKGVGGFIKPGDHVDVLNTFEVKFPSQLVDHLAKDYNVYLPTSKWVTKPVLQDALVLATAQKMYTTEGEPVLLDGNSSKSNTDAKAGDSKSGDKDKANDKDKDSGSSSKSSSKDKDKDSDAHAKIVNSVTLAVTPDQAAVLALAEQTGNLRLDLRHENYHELAPDDTVVDDQFFNIQEYLQKVSLDEGSLGGSKQQAAPDAPPPPTNQIQVYQGEQSTSVSF